ncbi:MAG: hypothetical protein SR3Q1_05230 [Quinella sp. 3Q1]|nr:hypothetical protein [Quinella sp. 3Q1]MBR6888164.1 hypothetical protein [Selenomonadaceae bacterium]
MFYKTDDDAFQCFIKPTMMLLARDILSPQMLCFEAERPLQKKGGKVLRACRAELFAVRSLNPRIFYYENS